jgi:hypothetical protein
MCAVSSLSWRCAQRQMAPNGATKVLPSSVREYSTEVDLDLVTRLATTPTDSRLRRVRVSIRCDTLPRRRRSWPCRSGPVLSASMILTVHLPMKRAGLASGPGPCISDLWSSVIPPCEASRAVPSPRQPLSWSWSSSARARARNLVGLLHSRQLGTAVYLLDTPLGLDAEFGPLRVSGTRSLRSGT